ncbi:MAG: phosphocholine cytidylyltransferase family protein [Ignavibacteriales bacterium]|nr:phosphocholine cytidylyltransferase family protein [Ignavibacteriales bacterium]
MKALILAAGEGKRLAKYTKNLPKGMLEFNGKTLIEWQICRFRKAGIDDINIVTGYMKDKINYPGIKYYHNPNYGITNMVESMLCAREIMDSEMLITYSDILFTDELLNLTSTYKGDIGVAVDKSWKEYWAMRYGTTENDLESLTIKDDKIVELGKPVASSKGIDYRYIGMIKLSKTGTMKTLKMYENKKATNESWIQSGKTFRNGYMTDLLNELILEGNIIQPIVSDGGWLEFDTNDDYEIMLNQIQDGKISNKFFE